MVCARPRSPDNGKVLGTDFSYKEAIQYMCNPGFKMTGADTRVCQADGKWGGEEPLCEG